MACRCAPSLLVLKQQIDGAWPDRSKASDGCCASSAHSAQNPTSDHEPDSSGFAHALDITHDPAHGVDCDRLFHDLRADRRVKYLIRSRRIWSRERGERAYTGTNPHTKHLHVSEHATATHDLTPWPIFGPGTTDPPEDDMPLTEAEMDRIAAKVVEKLHDPIAVLQKLDPWHDRINNLAKAARPHVPADVQDEIDALLRP